VRRKARIQRLEFQDFGIFIIKGTYFNLEDVGTKKVDIITGQLVSMVSSARKELRKRH
jgi:hypothetical protein